MISGRYRKYDEDVSNGRHQYQKNHSCLEKRYEVFQLVFIYRLMHDGKFKSTFFIKGSKNSNTLYLSSSNATFHQHRPHHKYNHRHHPKKYDYNDHHPNHNRNHHHHHHHHPSLTGPVTSLAQVLVFHCGSPTGSEAKIIPYTGLSSRTWSKFS